jgi:uncharacterized sporulation protein YeaH/YhbH (DUF444 family)
MRGSTRQALKSATTPNAISHSKCSGVNDMTEKPEALRLADEIHREFGCRAVDAAAELRRLHADNERLTTTAFQAQNAAIELAYKYQRLREQLERIAYASMSTHLNAAQMVTSLQEIAKAALRREDL